MKKFVLVFAMLFIVVMSFAVEYNTVDVLTKVTPADPSLPYFWLNFIVSFVGAYSIYGILAGPTMLGGSFILTKNKLHRKRALWGFVLGFALGLTLKIILLSR